MKAHRVRLLEELFNLDEPEVAYPSNTEEKTNNDKKLRKYQVDGYGKYYPIEDSVDRLSPGYYESIFNHQTGNAYFSKISSKTKNILQLKDSKINILKSECFEFFNLRDKYLEMNEDHNRGFLLWGPPGTGKTVAILEIVNAFIAEGGVVFKWGEQAKIAIAAFREIEPNRPFIVTAEDIEKVFHDGWEDALMDFLDSNSASSNMIFIATTNNPELLPDKIINRPGRFDVILNIDFPSDADRRIFVRSKIPKIKKRDLDNIVKDTKDWTFAHMRELLVAFKIYEKGYDAVKARINKMRSGKGLSAKSYQAKLHDVGGSSDDQNRIGFDTTEDGADNVIGFKIKRKR